MARSKFFPFRVNLFSELDSFAGSKQEILIVVSLVKMAENLQSVSSPFETVVALDDAFSGICIVSMIDELFFCINVLFLYVLLTVIQTKYVKPNKFKEYLDFLIKLVFPL